MNEATLVEANFLNKKIKALEKALTCFQWEEEYGGGSTNPTIIIEYDGGDGRDQQPIPMEIGPELTDFLKTQIKKELDLYRISFSNL